MEDDCLVVERSVGLIRSWRKYWVQPQENRRGMLRGETTRAVSFRVQEAKNAFTGRLSQG